MFWRVRKVEAGAPWAVGSATRPWNFCGVHSVTKVENSGVTMGWLLRLVTGAPLVVGPPTVLKFLVIKKVTGAPDGCVTPLVENLCSKAYMERKCADTNGTVLVPWAGHFRC